MVSFDIETFHLTDFWALVPADEPSGGSILPLSLQKVNVGACLGRVSLRGCMLRLINMVQGPPPLEQKSENVKMKLKLTADRALRVG